MNVLKGVRLDTGNSRLGDIFRDDCNYESESRSQSWNFFTGARWNRHAVMTFARWRLLGCFNSECFLFLNWLVVQCCMTSLANVNLKSARWPSQTYSKATCLGYGGMLNSER